MQVRNSMMGLMIAAALLFSITTAPETVGARAAVQAPGAQRGAAPQAARGGGGRGGLQTMRLVTTAWPDGGMIPLRYTQAGAEISPALQWTNVPAGIESFVVIFQDMDTTAGNATTDGRLHWMLWNIPGDATGVPQGVPDGFQLENGTRQISVSGSRYRGPGASATEPLHHYLLEVFALDTMLDISVPRQAPQEPNPNVQAIRESIKQAMVGHIRGKASYMGLFRRPE